MVSDFSPQDDPAAGAADQSAEHRTTRKAAKQARAEAKAASKAARRTTKARSKAATAAAKQDRKTQAADSKHRRSESKAARKAAKAARKTARAEAKAAAAAASAAATRPARVFSRLTDPKIAKRAVTIGKIVVPAVAPAAIAVAATARGYLDRKRAQDLGVPVEKVAQYRGPTGPTGARIDGFASAIDELASRKGNDLQVTRFVDVTRERLADLTAAVQASASMPGSQRRVVLRAVNRELRGMEADLVNYLIPAG